MTFIPGILTPSECDANGTPLDWKRCRMCEGRGHRPSTGYESPVPCRNCGGHGSLKAAALAELERLRRDRWSIFTPPLDVPFDPTVRCEGCGHLMSEGTWEGLHPSSTPAGAEENVRSHGIAFMEELGVVHFSPCDKGCDHGGPGRWRGDPAPWSATDDLSERLTQSREASWRQVDVRVGAAAFGMAGFDLDNALHVRPFDLRPENLSVLCLRCYAEKIKT